MATKYKKTSNNNNLLSKTWFVVLVIVLVVVTGILVVRFSQAADNSSLAGSILAEYERIRAARTTQAPPVPPTARQVLVGEFEKCGATGDFTKAALTTNSQGVCVVYARRFLDIVLENNPASANVVVSDKFSDNSGNALSMQERVKLFQQAINTNLNKADWSGANADGKQKLLADGRMSQASNGQLSIPADGQVDPQTWFWLNVIAYVYLAGTN